MIAPVVLIRFADWLIKREPCCTDVREGQTHLVTCTVTGIEMIWSPEEPESLTSAMNEHMAAHDRRDDTKSLACFAAQLDWEQRRDGYIGRPGPIRGGW